MGLRKISELGALVLLALAAPTWAATTNNSSKVGSEILSGLYSGSGNAGDTSFHLTLYVRGTIADKMDWSLKGGDIKVSCMGEAYTTKPNGIDAYEVDFDMTSGDCLHDSFAEANITAGASFFTYDVSQVSFALALTVGTDSLSMTVN